MVVTAAGSVAAWQDTDHAVVLGRPRAYLDQG
jgi:hypothetical protein